jgi:hypothetical protein
MPVLVRPYLNILERDDVSKIQINLDPKIDFLG